MNYSWLRSWLGPSRGFGAFGAVGALGALGLCSVVALSSVGCGGKKKADTTLKDDAVDAAIPKVDPTLCETEGKNVITGDSNQDGKPDVWRLFRTEDEGGTKVEYRTCRQVDIDHDGKKDWVIGYNKKGNVSYERGDFDYDGRFDMSALYDPKTGQLAEVERDTDFDGKFDLKETYDSTGVLLSVKRDRNSDGSPDLWEQYKDGILLAILYDDDFDNKVDRREEIPGARPKVEMPTTTDREASGTIGGAGSSAGSGSAAPK